MKSIILVVVGVLSLTLFSFKSLDMTQVHRLPGGSFISTCGPVSDTDLKRLGELTTIIPNPHNPDAPSLIFVRCESTCNSCKFTRSTIIAGKNCGTSEGGSVPSFLTVEQQHVFDEAERIMNQYLN